jgi:hypothetical protein
LIDSFTKPSRENWFQKWQPVTFLAKWIAEKGKNRGHVIIDGHVTPKPKLEGCTGGTTRHQPFGQIWKSHGDNFPRLSCPQFCSVFDGVFCNMVLQNGKIHSPNLVSIT